LFPSPPLAEPTHGEKGEEGESEACCEKSAPRRQASTPKDSEKEMNDDAAESKRLRDLKFNATRNAMYHSWRKAFLDFWNRIFSLIVIVAGTAAAADLGGRIGFADSIQYLAFLAALAGTLQLVFDFGGMAREHDFLRRQYYELLAQMAEEQNPPESVIAKWERDLFRLYADEPAPMRALDALAFNATVEAFGIAGSKRVKVAWYQVLLSQFVAFNRAEFPYAISESGALAP
jgi:hypothetical protein